MFKKLIIAIILSLFISVSAMAADVVKIYGLNLQGDLLYLFSEGEFAVGAGTTIATFYDIAELRGVFVSPLEEGTPDKAGAGIGINIVKVISKIGGVWLVSTLNPSVGVTALTNLSGTAHIEPAAYFSAVNIQF
mgnify:FL=1